MESAFTDGLIAICGDRHLRKQRTESKNGYFGTKTLCSEMIMSIGSTKGSADIMFKGLRHQWHRNSKRPNGNEHEEGMNLHR